MPKRKFSDDEEPDTSVQPKKQKRDDSSEPDPNTSCLGKNPRWLVFVFKSARAISNAKKLEHRLVEVFGELRKDCKLHSASDLFKQFSSEIIKNVPKGYSLQYDGSDPRITYNGNELCSSRHWDQLLYAVFPEGSGRPVEAIEVSVICEKEVSRSASRGGRSGWGTAAHPTQSVSSSSQGLPLVALFSSAGSFSLSFIILYRCGKRRRP
jgi:hypothetical protein